MRVWQSILKWLTIRDHKDMKEIERAITLMSKLLPMLQGLILGTWTLVIAFKRSLTLYLWLEIVVTVIVGVGVVGLRSKVARQRVKVNDKNEKEVAEEQSKIFEERKRRRVAEAKKRQGYDLNNRRRYVEDRLSVPDPYEPNQWSDADTIDIWNDKIGALQDQQRRTRRVADSIEEQGRALLRTTIVLYIALSVIFTISWAFKWRITPPERPSICCPEVHLNCPPAVALRDTTCCAGIDIKLDSLINIANKLKLTLAPKFKFSGKSDPSIPRPSPATCSKADLCGALDAMNDRLDSLLKARTNAPAN